ncbi:MAG: peptide-methionine (R)-S-oxide reductase MsrB [Gammaproteobacteria bacterium]|nr:peptide-methionine (R)-S-oxide reductase MsrB [Gammaproteobacteria bacterium]
MKRRLFITAVGAAALSPAVFTRLSAREAGDTDASAKKVFRSDEEWRRLLSEEQYEVLRNEGTERPGSSPLNAEKRAGTYVCAGCEQPLFLSDTKYESGTGWPSFFAPIEGALGTKTDYKLIWPRTEYHCSRCGGHQGHIFKDGPEPTGLRYCNNGVALKFVPAEGGS